MTFEEFLIKNGFVVPDFKKFKRINSDINAYYDTLMNDVKVNFKMSIFAKLKM